MSMRHRTTGRLLMSMVAVVVGVSVVSGQMGISRRTEHPDKTTGVGVTVSAELESSGSGVAAGEVSGASPSEGERASQFSPYIAKVTGSHLNIRSGPATVYYPVTQLDKGDLVVVMAEKHGWAGIRPVKGCFSYVASEYVQLPDYPDATVPGSSAVLSVGASADAGDDAGDDAGGANRSEASAETADQPDGNAVVTGVPLGQKPITGIVTGDSLRVRSGSKAVKPSFCEVHGKLDSGDRVTILGYREGYFEIVSPADCLFWVSLDYLDRVQSATDEMIADLDAHSRKAMMAGVVSSGAASSGEDGAETTVDGSSGSEGQGQSTGDAHREGVEAYYQAADLFEKQLAKPVEMRDFRTVKSLLAMAINKGQDPAVVRSAESLQRQVARLEDITVSLNRSRQQDQRLHETLRRIDEQLDTLESPRPREGQAIRMATGVLRRSEVFSGESGRVRYLVLGENEDILCYAVDAGEGVRLAEYLGRRVRLTGQSSYDAFSKVRVLHVNKVEVVETGAGAD